MRVAPAGLCLFALVSCAAASPGFSGTVQTEYVSVGSQIGGRVIATEVSAGQTVRRGAIIVRLDPAIPQAQYDEAVAQERAAQDALRALQAGTLPSQIEQARGSRNATRASSARWPPPATSHGRVSIRRARRAIKPALACGRCRRS